MVRVAVVGAGPTGVEAALACQQQGWSVTLYERGPRVASWVRDWGHVRLFTPWSMSVSPRVAASFGMPQPSDACPTGAQLADHLESVAARLDDVQLSTSVEQVAREGLLKSEEIGSDDRRHRPFRLLITGPEGRQRYDTADVVLDCTGTYGHPNPTGAGGIPALGERDVDVVRAIPAVDVGWAERHVLLVGAGNSAQTVARDLASVGASFDWVVRRDRPTWGAVDHDVLPDRATLVASSRRRAASLTARCPERPCERASPSRRWRRPASASR